MLGRAGPAFKRYKCFRRPLQVSISFSFLVSLSLFSFLFTGSESNVRHGRSRPQTLQMLLQALAGIYLFLFSFSLFLFSLFSLPVQKATLGTAGPAFKRYKCFRRPLQVFSLSLFSFLFTGSESNVRHGRSRLQTLQMLPQALAGISLFLFSLFLFSLFSLPVQKATLGRAGPAVKLQMLLQALAAISLSLFSFLFTGSESNVRQGRSRLQTLQMLPQALAGIYLFLFSFLSFSFLFSLYRFRKQR